jgi:hypothetical protein
MNEAADDATAGPLDDVTDSGVFQAVLDGYDAVYDALPNSRVFTEIWGTNAYGADFPDDFAHIGFLTVDEGGHLLQLLRGNEVLVDVACGAGGPWPVGCSADRSDAHRRRPVGRWSRGGPPAC